MLKYTVQLTEIRIMSRVIAQSVFQPRKNTMSRNDTFTSEKHIQ